MRRYSFFAAIFFLLWICGSLHAQEHLLQEEQDFRFAVQLADKQLHDIAALQFIKFADSWPTSPNAPEALFRAAESQEELKAYDRAAATYLRLILSYPQSPITDKALFNRGKLLAQLGDPLNAALTLERIRLFTPQSELVPLALTAAAQEYIRAGQPQQAFAAAQSLTMQYPDSPQLSRARYLMAQLHRSGRKPTQALLELDKIPADRVDNSLAVGAGLLRGQILADLGRYAQADSVLESTLNAPAVSDSTGAAAATLATSLASRGLLERAIQVCERILSRNLPESDRSRLQLIQGDCWTRLGDPGKALSLFNALNLASLPAAQQSRVAFRIGVLQERLGDAALALPWFARVLAAPDTLPGLASLQRIALVRQTHLLVQLGNPAEALRTLRLRFDDRPALRDQILLLRGDIQRTVMNDPPGALHAYGLLTEFYPDSPLVDEAALGSAGCHEAIGDRQSAIRAYQSYLALYPAADAAAMAQQRLELLLHYTVDTAGGGEAWIGQALLAGGNSRAALAWAAARIEQAHDFTAGLEILRQLPESGPLPDGLESRLAYLAGLCHLRLAEKYLLTGDQAAARAHTDSLRLQADWLQQNAPDAAEHRQLTALAQTMAWRTLADPRTAALSGDSLAVTLPDSLAAMIRLEGARISYRLATDSSSTLWLDRAAASLRRLSAMTLSRDLALDAELLQSRIYQARQLPDSAIAALRTALNRGGAAPQMAQAQLQLARLLEERQLEAEAIEIYRSWSAQHYYSRMAEGVRARLCSLYFKRQDFAAARECMQQHPEEAELNGLTPYLTTAVDEELLWLSAQAWLLQENLPNAIVGYQEYLRRAPQGAHRSAAMLTLADLYIRDNNPEAAAGHLAELIATTPADSLSRLALVRFADLLFDQKQYREAALKYEQAKTALSGDLQRQAAMRQVLCEFRLGNISRARLLADAFKKSYKDRRAEALFLNEDGLFCLTNKDFKAAETQLRELSGKYKDLPEGADGDMGLARMYAILNKPEEALKILSAIPEKYSDPRVIALAYVNLGEFYYQNRQLENCVIAGRKALELAVHGAEQQRAMQLLISVFDDLRLWDNAVVLLRQYIRDYPQAGDTFNRRVQLGVFLINLKEYDRGIDYLRGLLPLADAENEAEIQYWIAKAYAERGETAQAITEYLKVKYVCRPSKLPWGTTALYEAGQSYVKLGHLGNARTLFQQIVRELGVGDQFGRVANERIREIDALAAQQEG